MIADATLAYFAGMVDGDGYISIQSRPYKKTHYFWPVIGICGTSREPHDLAASIWGGNVARTGTHSTQWCIQRA